MKTITAKEFEELVGENKTLNILDVRNQDAFELGHIEGAVNLPLDELSGKIADLNPTEEYYIVCYSGNFSAMAAEFLTRKGLKASNVQGGMNGYRGVTVS